MQISAGDNSRHEPYFLIFKHNQINLKDLQNIKWSTTKTIPTYYGAKDAKLTIKDFHDIKQKYENVNFKYKENNWDNDEWVGIPVNGEIKELSPGTYNIGVEPKSLFQLVELSSAKIKSTNVLLDISNQAPLTIEKNKYWKAPPKIVFTLVHEEYKGDGKGQIELVEGEFEDTYSKLQYRESFSSIWKDVSTKTWKVNPGTYSFRWTPKNHDPTITIKYKDENPGALVGLDHINLPETKTIKQGDPIPNPPTLTFSQENEKFKNVNDGKIKIISSYWNDLKRTSKLQYKLESNADWKDVGNQNLKGLKPGEYAFKWVTTVKGLYDDGKKEKSISPKVTLEEGHWVVPPNTNITKDSDETVKGAKDGKITITNFNNTKSQLQYRFMKNDDWKNVETSPLKGLKPGTYIFRWLLKGEGFYSKDRRDKFITDDKNKNIQIRIEESTKIYLPLVPKIQITPPTTIVSNDASVVFVISEKEKSFKLEYYDSQNAKWIKIPQRDLVKLQLKFGLNYIMRRSNKDSQLQYQDQETKKMKGCYQ